MFVLVPTFYALWLSFTDASGFNTPQLIGLDNYITAFTDPDSLGAIGHTILYAALYLPSVIIAALAVAILLNRSDLVARGAMRTIIFVPFIISMAVAALAWGFILDPELGILPYWLSKIGLHIPDLLNSTTWAMPTVVFVAVWKNFGYFMVIFLAGLQNVPRELYEAASIDGAGTWKKFTSVTLPGLRPTMTYVVVLAANGAFQAFDQIYIMTKGGPLRSTETVVYRVYTEGFMNFRLGEASALSFVLMALTLLVGIGQLIISRRQEKDLA
ncbi:sugar ABC transporter permease [Actinomyces sp. MRS3W]|uniref:carbohydrate ABC transporter permease n=1 Tax=Actinomyces sp. MRS3W TaxID=2800796 RepID=UPI0028FD65DD|nr:sugar ABC transporter permease [Actinomyces sp. MRS3W]MDU0348746.1 sugar ABC transporter permease [Actinomyces sp. MRS3W]